MYNNDKHTFNLYDKGFDDFNINSTYTYYIYTPFI